MGNAEGKPLDASDITDLEAAKAEIVKIRETLRNRRTKLVTGDNFPKNFRKRPSVMYNVLTQEDYEKNMNLIGPRGYTFDQCIQCGIDGRGGTGVGIPDEESYYLWKDFYDKVLDARHGFPADAIHKTDLDYSKVDISKLPDDLNDFCVSTRIRAARNISGFGLPPGITRVERREVAKIIEKAVGGLEGELAGKYYSLETLSESDAAGLRADHFLFQMPNPNAMIFSSGGCRDWPEGRGIFHNAKKTFLIWVNEEDQIRVISMQQGGNVKEVFARWARGVNAMEKTVKAAGYSWMQNDHVGNLSSCVSNLGTGLRASMHIKLPCILKAIGQDALNDLCEGKFHMECRGTGGEHTEAGSDGKVDISNNQRIGKTEVQLVQLMVDGIVTLIDLEKKAKAGEDIKPLIEAL